MKYYKIAVIPGDGIGKEVVPAGIKVLNKIQKCYDYLILNSIILIGAVNTI